MFSNIKHPLSIGLMLIIQSLNISIIINLISERAWFSYILFLIFIGAMIVIFIYVIVMASNDIFNFSIKIFITFISLLIICYIINFIFDYLNFLSVNNIEIININWNNIYKENLTSINKLYNFPTNIITLMLINYLFFTLIIVVKITNLHNGPIRTIV